MGYLIDDLLGASAASSTSGLSSSGGEEPIWDINAIQVVGIVLYSLLFFGTLALYIFKRFNTSVSLQQMATLFYIGLPVFMVLRVIWFILEMNTTSDAGLASNLINRVCFCVFLFVFNSLLFYWIDTVHTTVNVAFAKEAFKGSLDYEFITPMGRVFFWIATAVVIALTLILAIVRAILIGTADPTASDYKDMKDTIGVVYDVNNIIISLTFLVYALCFLIYGTTLNCRIGKNRGTTKSWDLIKAEVFAVVLTCCFIIRCIMFSYRIMTKKYLENNLYICLSYFVPEIIPTLMCIWSVNTKMFNDADSNLGMPDYGDEEENGEGEGAAESQDTQQSEV